MNERYLQLQVLKSGPCSRVVLCLDPASQHKIVVKELLPQAPAALHRQLKTEAMLLETMNGKGAPALKACGLDDFQPWLAEEYIEGIRLDAWLKQKPSRREKAQILIQIIRRIEQVHRVGFLYLDLKADNVLIENDQVRLIDFNACLKIGSSGLVLSSPDALPPEGKDGRPLDERADQIGLGSLWQLMNGPSQISWIALQPDPARRFCSLEAMAKALEKSAAGGSLKKKIVLAASLAAAATGAILLWNSRIGAAHPMPGTLPESAAQTLEQFAGGRLQESDLRSTAMFTQAAAQALCEQNLPLAAWLYRLEVNSQDPAVMQSRLLLGWMLEIPADYSILCQALKNAAGADDSGRSLSDLLDAMNAHSILLDPADLEVLLGQFVSSSRLCTEAAESLLGYLLFCQSESQSPVTLSPELSSRLEWQQPDLFTLYQAGSPGTQEPDS